MPEFFFLHEPAAATAAAAAWQDCIVFTDDENIAMPRMHSGLKIGGKSILIPQTFLGF